jgi:hypothetical protein
MTLVLLMPLLPLMMVHHNYYHDMHHMDYSMVLRHMDLMMLDHHFVDNNHRHRRSHMIVMVGHHNLEVVHMMMVLVLDVVEYRQPTHTQHTT